MYYVPIVPIYQSASLPTIFGGFYKLREVLLSEKIDLVHAHQAFSAMANEAIIHARTMNIPTVFTDHSLFGFADVASILMNKALKFSLADVQRVICVSHTSRENTVLRACVPPSRVYVIPNAVDMACFYPTQKQSLQDIEDCDRTVVIMSRLVYRKGIDLLIAIIPVLAAKHPRLHFVIGGDGPKRQDLEEAIRAHDLESRVVLHGAIHRRDVREFLGKGSIFLNCSLTEAFCVALVEAAAVGLTIVSTAVGGVPEVLPEEMMILADASPRGLVAAVDEAISRLAIVRQMAGGMEESMYLRYRFEMAQRQHSAVTQMYSWSVVASRTEVVYQDAMRDNSRLRDRLHRYHLCGKWFGKICVFLAVVDWLLLITLNVLKPRHRIPPANDVKNKLM